MNIVAQSIEVYEAIQRAIEILDELNLKQEKPEEITLKAGTGIGAIEAPRGILFHKYTLDKEGFCKKAHIITPTSQNLAKLELDIKKYLSGLLKYDKAKIRAQVEELIRAYDPCISCSTHFLEIVWQ